MEYHKPIKSVNEFIDRLNQHLSSVLKELNNIRGRGVQKMPDILSSPIINKSIYFRGHAQSFCQSESPSQEQLIKTLKPSIYRKTSWIESEDKIFKDAILSNPDDFVNETSTLEKLVKMQHYFIPTRLLDITTNALMALFFACESANKMDGDPRDGYVFIFDFPETHNKYYDSDTASVIANITKRPYDGLHAVNLSELLIFYDYEYQERLKSRIDILLKNYKVDKKILLNKEKLKELRDNKISMEGICACLDLTNLKRTNEKFFPRREAKVKDIIIQFLNEDNILQKLLHEIQNEKPYFAPKININHLAEVICVKPLLKNRRIVRQDGAFILFGMNMNKEICPDVPKNRVRGIITIDKSSKVEIMRTLALMGQSYDKVYPELEHVAKYLKEKYS